MNETQKTSSVSQWEKLLLIFILVMAFVSRFSELGVRAMSHDESLHTYYSYLYYNGSGYQHSPMMHGPLQFHFLNATFQTLGVTDFTSRIPAALCGVAAIALIWLLRKELGKFGTLAAMGLTLISPYMLFYSRYVRNEALIMPIAILTLWNLVRYYQTEDKQYLLWLSVISALNFTIKETAFFYTAQAMVFAGLVFLVRTDQRKWTSKSKRKNYYIALMVAIIAAMIAFLLAVLTNIDGELNMIFIYIGGAIVLGLAVWAVQILKTDMGSEAFADNPSMSIMINLGAIVLPMMSPLIVSALGHNPIAYDDPNAMLFSGITIGVLFLGSFLLGWWWDLKAWVQNQIAFYSIFTIFYTSFFSNPDGFYTGIVGSLGYWIEQQEVARGSQPWYYYLLIQLPVYEYLPFIGSLIGMGVLVFLMVRANRLNKWEKNQFIFPLLLAFWSLSSLAVFSYAGEKMPWLTVHITIPMFLMTGWLVHYLVKTVDWEAVKDIENAWRLPILMMTTIMTGVLLIGKMLGTTPPFAGMLMEQLQATNHFILLLVLFGLSVFLLYKVSTKLERKTILNLFTLIVFGLLSLTTLRTSYTASFEHYDQGNEYLVYAHSGSGVKNALNIIEELSYQTMDGKSIPISYDGETSWPMTWYFRDFRNAQVYYVPEADGVMQVPEFTSPIVLLDDKSYAFVTPQLKQDYVSIDLIRMVWPNQDYFIGMIGDRFFSNLGDAAYREAFFDIWWDRDFTAYTTLNGYVIQESNWSPADLMRLYVSRDYVDAIWNFELITEGSDS